MGCNAAPAITQTSAPESARSTQTLTGIPSQIKIRVIVSHSGGAAEPFGIPAKNGAEAIISALNQGDGPAPYEQPGEAVADPGGNVDEAMVAEEQASELRRLYHEENVDFGIGYISSRDCLKNVRMATRCMDK